MSLINKALLLASLHTGKGGNWKGLPTWAKVVIFVWNWSRPVMMIRRRLLFRTIKKLRRKLNEN